MSRIEMVNTWTEKKVFIDIKPDCIKPSHFAHSGAKKTENLKFWKHLKTELICIGSLRSVS